MNLSILQFRGVKLVAFDLGGVLAYSDESVLTEEEITLLHFYKKYIRRKKINSKDREFLEYAKSKMADIYLKMNKLNEETMLVLEMLKSDGIKTSIWTNNTPYINSWLENVGLIRIVGDKNIINSFYLGYDKPDRRFYLEALHVLNVDSLNVLFLDDNIKNVLSAIKCGISSIEYNMQMSLESTVREAINNKNAEEYKRQRILNGRYID